MQASLRSLLFYHFGAGPKPLPSTLRCSLLPLAIDFYIFLALDAIRAWRFLCTFPKTLHLLYLSTTATILVGDLGWRLLNSMPAAGGDCCKELLTHPAVTRLVNISFQRSKGTYVSYRRAKIYSIGSSVGNAVLRSVDRSGMMVLANISNRSIAIGRWPWGSAPFVRDVHDPVISS